MLRDRILTTIRNLREALKSSRERALSRSSESGVEKEEAQVRHETDRTAQGLSSKFSLSSITSGLIYTPQRGCEEVMDLCDSLVSAGFSSVQCTINNLAIQTKLTRGDAESESLDRQIKERECIR